MALEAASGAITIITVVEKINAVVQAVKAMKSQTQDRENFQQCASRWRLSLPCVCAEHVWRSWETVSVSSCRRQQS